MNAENAILLVKGDHDRTTTIAGPSCGPSRRLSIDCVVSRGVLSHDPPFMASSLGGKSSAEQAKGIS
jgi:hypothetical protein